MGLETHFPCSRRKYGAFSLLPIFPIAFAALTTGCGGGGHGVTGTGPIAGENTSVVLLASSTANDQLTEFSITLTGLTLADDSGKMVTLLAKQTSDDFMHLNGTVEPLATVTVPQGIYTSASATAELALPECAGQTSGEMLIDEALGNIKAPGDVTINIPQPITIDGTAMGLVLNLQVSASAPINGGCSSGLTNNVQVAPVFNLTPLTIGSEPTNSSNGKMAGVRGLVASVNADGTAFVANAFYSVNAGYPASWPIAVNGNTLYQGIGDASQLAAGMPLDMDVNIQTDGSLLATRVAVPDTNTSNLGVAYGPPLSVFASGAFQATYPVMNAIQVGQMGDLSDMWGGYSVNGAAYQISGQLANLGSLPFPAAFNAENMVDGENILFSTHTASLEVFEPVSMITLLPQTIDGTVTATGSDGGFTTYTVTLAPYDLFPNLAVQPAQTTLLTNPNTVVVYADGNTQMLNQNTLAVGSVFRFYGLVFNDSGTLRMDCAQVNDGVAE
jgi:hypothetical protein